MAANNNHNAYYNFVVEHDETQNNYQMQTDYLKGKTIIQTKERKKID